MPEDTGLERPQRQFAGASCALFPLFLCVPNFPFSFNPSTFSSFSGPISLLPASLFSHSPSFRLIVTLTLYNQTAKPPFQLKWN